MKKSCFVVMGFGEKTDYRTQRKLNLDKTYKIIKVAVDEAGLECIRADDIIHSGMIDKPMYEQLLDADIAIADLSTSNENALYELGVRHALRPHTTIVIAESKFKFPFDLSHLVIRPYEHMGTGIDFEEADRLKNELKTALQTLLDGMAVDSPVYTHIPELKPPMRRAAIQEELASTVRVETTPDKSAQDEVNPTFSALLEGYQKARSEGDFVTAKTLIGALRKLQPEDDYLVQQEALVTYKSNLPNPIQALLNAKQILLDEMKPAESNDPETLGLWGAIHKRLWELEHNRDYLEEALAAYERGFYLKRDYYTGINYAYLLNQRAILHEDSREGIADQVIANRVRRQVVDIVESSLAALPRSPSGQPEDPHEAYWLGATRLEALLCLGEIEQLAEEQQRLYRNAPEEWMKETTDQQLQSLQALLDSTRIVDDKSQTTAAPISTTP